MRTRLSILILCLALVGCSTTRTLAPGEYRLAKNEVKVDDKRFSVNELTPYIRQQANTYFIFGWNPFLCIYNWSDGSERAMSRFFRKIGTAPVVYNENLVPMSEQNITNHLKYLGYYNAEVTSEKIEKGRTVKMVYNVKLGKRIPIDEIRFDIPLGGDFEQSFWADSSNVLIHKGSFLSEKLLDAESDRSAQNMRNKGFYGFSKGFYSFVADTLAHNGRASLDYQVRDYVRGGSPDKAISLQKYRFGDVSISFDKDLKFKEKVLRNLNTIVPGTPYSEEEVNKTYSRLSSLQVFSGVNIRTTPTDSNTVNCDISLTKAKLKGFKVNLESSVTSSGLIGISPQLSFYHKNIFHGGEWLNMGFSGTFQFKPKDNLKANEFGITASVSFPRPVFFGKLNIKSQDVARTEIKGLYNYQSRPEFTRHIFSASMGYTGKIKNRFIYQVYPVQIGFVKLTNMTMEFMEMLIQNPYLLYSYLDHFDGGLGGTLLYTTNADIVPKTSYRYARLNFETSGNLLGLFTSVLPKDDLGEATFLGVPFSQYVKGELNLVNNWRFGIKDGQQLAARFSIGAGYAYGNSLSLPYEKQFFLGGANSMRGWQARMVGPGTDKPNTYTVLPSQTGDFKLEADLEYRFRMFWKLEGSVFAETGNIWTFQTPGELVDDVRVFHFNRFYKELAADWGVGLRVNLDFIVLRVDFGMKVHDPSKDYGQRWRGPKDWFSYDGYSFHFGVGYPF